MIKVKNTPLRNAGFTLLELVITIAVIAILAMTVIPKVNQMLSGSREVATKNEMREIQRAILGDAKEGLLGYKANVGGFPAAVSNLYTDPGTGFNNYTQVGWNGPYVDMHNRDADMDGSIAVGEYDIDYDAWGNQYTIGYVTDGGKSRMAIVSRGADLDDDSGGSGDIVVYLE